MADATSSTNVWLKTGSILTGVVNENHLTGATTWILLVSTNPASDTLRKEVVG